MKTIARVSLAFAAIASLSAAPASAQLIVGSGWNIFTFGSGLGPVNGPWNSFAFNPVTATVVTFTDYQCRGDNFTLSWSGSSVGSLLGSASSGNCDSPGFASTPDDGLASALYSSGAVAFAPGNYTLTLDLSQDCCGGGNGGIRADNVVPEPATMTLLATGLMGMAAARRKKRNG